MAAYRRIEARLAEMLESAGVSLSRRMIDGQGMARLARQHDLISDETLAAVEGLSVLRDLTVHAGGDISAYRANDYLALADAVLYALRSKPSSSDHSRAPSLR